MPLGKPHARRAEWPRARVRGQTKMPGARLEDWVVGPPLAGREAVGGGGDRKQVGRLAWRAAGAHGDRWRVGAGRRAAASSAARGKGKKGGRVRADRREGGREASPRPALRS